MNKIIAIIWKDTRLRFGGWTRWLFFLILPIAFTFVLAGGTGASSDQRVRLAVADEANSPLSQQLLAALERSPGIRPDLLSKAEADDQFAARRVAAELVIPAEFDMGHVRQGPVAVTVRQQPNNTNALAAYQAVMAEVERIGSAVEVAAASTEAAQRVQPFASDAARQAYFEAALSAAQTSLAQAPNRLALVQGATPDQVAYDPRANSSAGQLITWVFIPLLGLSAMFARERQGGTLRRLLITPTNRSIYLLGTVLGQVLTALVQMLLLIAFGSAVMGLNWGHAPAALALILVSSALAAAALGALLGALTRNEGQAGGLSWMLGMLMALLGGCWYPAELFPQAVRSASQVLPTTWAMQGMLNIVLRNQGLEGVWLPSVVLLGMAVLFLTIGVSRFRFE